VLGLILWRLDINNGFIFVWGKSGTIPNNNYLDINLPISFSTTDTCAITATHAWTSGDCAFNHVITGGILNISAIRLSNRRIINNDTNTILGYYMCAGY